MAVTISSVRAFEPDLMTHAGDAMATSAGQLGTQDAAGRQSLTALTAGWEGSAADGAVAGAEATLRDQQRIQESLDVLHAILVQGGAALGAQRQAIVDAVDDLEGVGYQVSDDGTVSIKPGSRLEQLAQMSPTNRMQIEARAATASHSMKEGLVRFASADAELAEQLMVATGPLDTIESGARSVQSASFSQTVPDDDWFDNDDVFPEPIDPGGAEGGNTGIGAIPPELI